MAEVTRVLGRMQLDTEGGLVPAGPQGSVRVTPSVRRSKLVKDDSAAVSATKAGREMAVARNKAVGCFTGEIGVTKADAGNKEAAGSFTGEIVVTKAELGNKEAAGSFTGEIGVTKAEVGNKEAAGSFTGEVGVTKAGLNKEATGSFTGEIGVTKAGLGNKEAAGSFSGEIGVTKAGLNKDAAGIGMVTAASGIKLTAGSEKPREERKAEPVVGPVTKERVPDAYIERIKRRPLRKMHPLKDSIAAGKPEYRQRFLATNAHIDYLVDLEQDCLRQYEEKGYAEIGVDYTDGFKKVFILPNQSQPE